MELNFYREQWQRKPVLRDLYADFHRRMFAQCVPGLTLEIGGGIGNLEPDRDDLVITDIQVAPWLDTVADAQALPFRPGSFDNIVMMDVLHHIECPMLFFAEAQRLLRPGGRVVMLEPSMTPLARLFYTYLHNEPVDMSADPFGDCRRDPRRDPYDANSAVPHLVFRSGGERFRERFPQLEPLSTGFLSLFAYPLSGGFQRWSLMPRRLLRGLLGIEDRLLPMLGPLMAFRLLIVLGRRAPTPGRVRA